MTELREGEGKTAAAMLVTIFLLLASYYMLKVARETEVLKDAGLFALRGAELKALARGVQAVFLAAVFIPLYSRFSAAVPRRWLIVGMTLFFAMNIELFWLLSTRGVANVGFYFYVWVGIFNVSMIAQFWSYANDIYHGESGRRLFPFIMVGASLGGVAGVLADRYIKNISYFDSNPFAALHIAAGLLLLSLGFFLLVERREATGAGARIAGEPLALGNGLVRLLQSPYLRLIALMLVLLNLVNSTGEYLLDTYILQNAGEVAAAAVSAAGVLADSEAGQAAWQSAHRASINHSWNTFYLVVNVTALVLQAFIASRVVRYAGLRATLFLLPVVAFGTYGLAAVGVGFLAFASLKAAENATDYSIYNTVRQLLWLPTSREEKYQAKQAADTIFTRLGDALHSVVILVGTGVVALAPRGFAVLNLVFVVLWLVTVVALAREYRKVRHLAFADDGGAATAS